ncbi:hypothetical protein ACQI4L_08990 [Mycolicibacterium litorale]|uniref:hypothetical protein n=1 Tax=Mycolicibacterium litorale TaxID=758802 RepID=UPI003CEBA3DB
MTYRWVPKRWLRFLQVATLLLTAAVGLGIVALPRTAAQLSKLEQTMSGDWFGWVLFTAGMLGGVAELAMWQRQHERYTVFVAVAHIAIVGTLAGYISGAVWGVLSTNWRTFITPVLLLLVLLWNLGFVQRRPRDQLPTAFDPGPSPRLQGRDEL